MVPSSKKIIAHDSVVLRSARSGKYPPLIISIPKKIVNLVKLKKGESLRIYTDGEIIYIDRFEVPEI